jgi:ABC-type branched-subunit amino acid transport system substrate-binding protein
MSTPGTSALAVTQALQASGNKEFYGDIAPKSLLRPTPTAAVSPTAKAFVAAYLNNGGVAGGQDNASYSHDSVEIIAQALEKAKSTNSQQIQKVLQSGYVFHGLRSTFVFSKTNRFGEKLDGLYPYIGYYGCPVVCVSAPAVKGYTP